jgi:hypothetical protein
VYRTTTVDDGSGTWTTLVPCSSGLILKVKPMSSTKTDRGVSGSAAMGGGGACAAAGSTYMPPAITLANAAVTAAYFGEMKCLIDACIIVVSLFSQVSPGKTAAARSAARHCGISEPRLRKDARPDPPTLATTARRIQIALLLLAYRRSRRCLTIW